jgi:hypothetical protein
MLVSNQTIDGVTRVLEFRWQDRAARMPDR